MKITVAYDALVDALNMVKIALNQKSIKEEGRKVTFIASDDSVSVSAFTVTTSVRGSIDATVEDKGVPTSLKSAELSDILSAFSGMSKTHATEVDIETAGQGKVRVTVHEEANNEEDADLANNSTFWLMGQNIPAQQLEFITQESPSGEGVSAVDVEELSFALSTLMKNMSSEINNKNNVVYFDEKYVFVSSDGLTVVRNGNGELLKEVGLNHNQVSVLNAMLGEGVPLEGAFLREGRGGGLLYFNNDKYEAFLQNNRFDQRAIKLNVLESPFSGEGKEEYNGFMLNKPYFMDIMRRAELTAPNINLGIEEIDTGEVVLKVTGATGNFEQNVSLEANRGSDNLIFTLPVSVLRSCIVNNALVGSEELFVYFDDTRKPTQKKVFLMDDTDSWMSVVVVPVRENIKKGDRDA